MNYNLALVFWAYLLDILLGDPRWSWHPVRIIGRIIAWLELKLNKENFNRVFTGALCMILVIGLTITFVALSLELARRIHPALYALWHILLIYFALSIKDLANEANKVKAALESKDIIEARKNLSLIVGRDTDTLNEQEIVRAAVETIAESIMDGIIAPLFYYFLGGPVLMWFYKAVNTLDSMVGYTNARFIEFGRVSAKLDGVMNFIPARLTSLLIGISSWFCGKNGFAALRWGLRYFLKGPAFNSQMTEAAMAGVLGVQLGGENFYNAVSVQKPLIGERLCPLEIRHIKESIGISYLCSASAILLGIVLKLAIIE